MLAALHQILEAGFGKESVALGKLHFNSLFLSGDFFKLYLEDCFIITRVRILGCCMLSKGANVFERELILVLIESKQRVILTKQALA